METNSLKDTMIDYCLNILKREDIKNEFKHLMRPMLDVVLQEIYPYIYLTLMFVIICAFGLFHKFVLSFSQPAPASTI